MPVIAEYPAVVELSSLDGMNGFKLSGEADGDQSGFSVASAGDVNGDGFDDVIVGARYASGNYGASYVVFGTDAVSGSNIDLASLDGTNGFKIGGAGAFDQSGFSVASAGDVNGDGFDDVIVGARYADPNSDRSGASYVVFGTDAVFASNIDLASLDGMNGFKLSGEADGDQSGFSVASAGDVNGDGIDDVIVGAVKANASGYDSGASYVVFGTDVVSGSNIDLASLDGMNGFKISGAAGYDNSGRSVASAGDVNGDGIDDLIVGAPQVGSNGTYSGASYVVFGTDLGFVSNIDLASLDGTNGFKLSGESILNYSGFSVASAGDVNGDGFDDLVIGTPKAGGGNSGASYVVFGTDASFLSNIELLSLDGTNGFKLSGAAAGDSSGRSVASAGDVNGDGFDDLIVGAFGADPNDGYSGASYVVFGQASGFASNIDLTALDGNNGFQLSGVAEFDYSGTSVASAGDVNGDGFADLIVGAPLADPNDPNSGASYVVFGSKPRVAVDRAGTDIAQTIRGGDFADTLSGQGGGDTLVGYLGADSLEGGAGADTLDGGGGSDAASYAGAVAGVTADLLTPASNTGEAMGDIYISIERLIGSGFGDTLSGNAGANALVGGAGDDTITGGGNDKLTGGLGADQLIGNGGTDTASYAQAAATDAMTGAGLVIDLVAPDQNTGEAAGDAYYSIERVIGSGFADTINGSNGDNSLSGGAGSDALDGRGGNDTLDGGSGIDTMMGGDGNDTYKVASSADVVAEIAGGGTRDTVLASVSYTLAAGASIEVLRAAVGSGLSLAGNEFANVVIGGTGGDSLDGGAGNDKLTGGAGADTFTFSTGLGAGNVDQVNGFSVADDTIGLDDAIFAALATAAGNALADAEFYVGAAAHDADDRIVYNAVNGKLFYDADGDGAGAALLFAKLSPGLVLTHDDFAVV